MNLLNDLMRRRRLRSPVIRSAGSTLRGGKRVKSCSVNLHRRYFKHIFHYFIQYKRISSRIWLAGQPI